MKTEAGQEVGLLLYSAMAAASFLKPFRVDWLLRRGGGVWLGETRARPASKQGVSRGRPFELPLPVSLLDSTVCRSYDENQTCVIFGF